jgi:hypothetical protein
MAIEGDCDYDCYLDSDVLELGDDDSGDSDDSRCNIYYRRQVTTALDVCKFIAGTPLIDINLCCDSDSDSESGYEFIEN